MMHKPPLVFMIDAGSCWKNHQVDLSAASGRKKGKIWCFTKDAGFACPYARLGMDLDTIVKAQGTIPSEGGDGDDKPTPTTSTTPAAKPKPVKAIASTTEPSRKKRKLAPTVDRILASASRALEQAVRGGVASAHPTPYAPAATHTLTNAQDRRKPIAALEILARPVLGVSRGRRVAVQEVDLDGLVAMTPEHGSPDMSAGDLPDMDENAMSEEEEQRRADEEAARDLGMFEQPVALALGAPTPIVEIDLTLGQDLAGLESDDDDDDFHVTMTRELSPLPRSLKVEDLMAEIDPLACLPFEDGEASSSSSSEHSVVRTPTPPADIAAWSLSTDSSSTLFDHSMSAFGIDAPFHSVGLGSFDDGGWDAAEGIKVKVEEDQDQGWSRAGTPFGARFTGFGSSKSGYDSPLEMEPMELDTIPFPATPSHVWDSASPTWSRASSACVSRALSRQSSICTMRSSRSSIVTGLVAHQIPHGEDAPRESRRLSLAPSSRSHSPHPVILYSPVTGDKPIKSGLSHRYLIDVQTEEVDVDEDAVDPVEAAKELEGLLDFGSDDAPVVDLTASVSSIGIKRPRSPSF